MYCEKCGKQTADGAAFCASCGAQLTARSEVPRRRSRKGITMVAALVGVLAVGGVIAFFALNSQHNEIYGEWGLAIESSGVSIQVNFDFDESKEVEVETESKFLDGTEFWGTCRGTWEYLYEKNGSSCYEIILDRTANKEVVNSILGDGAPEVDVKVVLAVPTKNTFTGFWEIEVDFFGSSSTPPLASNLVCSASVDDNMDVSYSYKVLDGYGEETLNTSLPFHAATPEPGRLVIDDGASQYSAVITTPWKGL